MSAEAQRNYMARLKARAAAGVLDLDSEPTNTKREDLESLTPLEYMLRVMNDPTAEKDRRDKMAIAAAQYMHAKQEPASAKTKKEEKEAAAEDASEGKFAPAAAPKLSIVGA